MIVDANILLYATDSTSPHHGRSAAWLTEALNGDVRVGLPWQSVAAFLRISTHPRITADPLTSAAAQQHVDRWLEASASWVPPATGRTMALYRDLALRHHITGNLVPDAHLAALALEYGVAVVSADTDFARFPEVRWVNPLAE